MADTGNSARVPVVFDWYAASIPGVDADEFIGRFIADHDLVSVAPFVGKTHGYENGWRLVRGDEVVASVLHGGNGDAALNAWASGFGARGYSEWIRRHFPAHYLTRADAAMDFNQPNSWADLQDVFFDLKNDHTRVQTSVVGDLFGGKKGVTYYLGSPKSEARARFYQKGLQIPEAGNPHHVRAELAVRPKGLARQVLASQPASILWGYTPWSRTAFERLQGFDPGQVVRETARRTTLEAKLSACHRQYGKVIAELRSMLGNDTVLVDALLAGRLPSEDQQK